MREVINFNTKWAFTKEIQIAKEMQRSGTG